MAAALARGDGVIAASRRSVDLVHIKNTANVNLPSLDASSTKKVVDQLAQEPIFAWFY